MRDSRISGFYRMSIDRRLAILQERGVVDDEMAGRLRRARGSLSREVADRMIENVIGVFGLPLAVAPNFLVNGREHLVPMVIEEPSVVAAVSAAAKLIRDSGGFVAKSMDPVLIGQIHLCGVSDPDKIIAKLASAQAELLDSANALHPRLVARGGGATGAEFRRLSLQDGRQVVVVHLHVDTRDAMGANIVNSMCEGIAAEVESIAGVKAHLKILSNLADRSMVTATASISLTHLEQDSEGAAALRDGIVVANDLALADPYRAATHNKGIMNGIDAVALATGNDWRALEAGAHAYAARDGAYRALTRWSVGRNGDLLGELSLPVRVGVVGGSLRSNPAAIAGLCIAGVQSSSELGELIAAVGLAQNFAALKALTGEGIQKGHMRLHARSVAVAAGVPDRLSTRIVDELIESGNIREWKAKELLAGIATPQDPSASGHRGSGEASGKVILLGEHAVVYGRPALAIPVKNAIHAAVREHQSGTRMTIPAWNIDLSMPFAEPAEDGAAALLQFLVRKLGIETEAMRIDVDARIPPAVGLGSSAALAVALIRAINQSFGIGLSDTEINELAFECEKLAHGTPSGIDNTLAVFGRPIVFEKAGIQPVRELVLKEDPPLVIASSGSHGSTREQVDGVRRRRRENQQAYDRIFDEIGRLSIEGAEALVQADYARLGTLMNIGQGLLNALGVSTPLIEEMIDIARSSGALGAKLTGAGGGGSVVLLCPGKTADVSLALASAGFEIIDPSLLPGGDHEPE